MIIYYNKKEDRYITEEVVDFSEIYSQNELLEPWEDYEEQELPKGLLLCKKCEGSGVIVDFNHKDYNGEYIEDYCSVCEGSGVVDKRPKRR